LTLLGPPTVMLSRTCCSESSLPLPSPGLMTTGAAQAAAAATTSVATAAAEATSVLKCMTMEGSSIKMVGSPPFAAEGTRQFSLICSAERIAFASPAFSPLDSSLLGGGHVAMDYDGS